MNKVSFIENIMESKKLLEDWGLLDKAILSNINNPSISKYSNEFIELSREENYFALYKCAIENDDYDFILKDKSFFQLSYDFADDKKCDVIRFAYYPTVDLCTYEEFIVEVMEEDIEKIGDGGRELYQQYLCEQEPAIRNEIRYDYDESLYVNKIHSAAHIHFGNEEGIRIPINSQLKPSAFVKMVFEYFHYSKWKTMVASGENSLWINKHDTDLLDHCFFDNNDQLLPYYYIQDRKR